jgi:hypothetical protein
MSDHVLLPPLLLLLSAPMVVPGDMADEVVDILAD